MQKCIVWVNLDRQRPSYKRRSCLCGWPAERAVTGDRWDQLTGFDKTADVNAPVPPSLARGACSAQGTCLSRRPACDVSPQSLTPACTTDYNAVDGNLISLYSQ